MEKIKINKSPTADTRTSKEIVSKEQLLESSEQHIEDVKKALDYMIDILNKKANKHDYTKIDNIDEFYDDFHKVQLEPWNEFMDMEWFKKHVSEERHHLKNHCPDDVDLFDVLEMIADGVMAGMARSGEIYPFEIDNEVLQKAVQNTADKLKDQVEVEDEI